MPEATLKFTLPDERSEFAIATHGIDYYSALWDIQQYLSDLYNHSPVALSEEQFEILTMIIKRFNTILVEKDVNMDDVE